MNKDHSPPASRLFDVAAGAHSVLLHERMLGNQLYAYALVRFLVVGAMAGGACFGRCVVGIKDLDVHSMFIIAFALACYNVVVFIFARSHRQPVRNWERRRLLAGVMHITIVLDYVFLTCALWVVGGPQSPFQAFYILHVIIACVLFSVRWAYLHALIGYLMLAGLSIGEWVGFIPQRFPLGAVGGDTLNGRFVLTILVVQGMLMGLTVFFLTGLTQRLRVGEEELIRANDKLDRLSRIRRDFLRMGLHNLKSPVAATAMLLNTFKLSGSSPLSEHQQEVVGRCEARLAGLNAFLNDLQLLSSLEIDEIRTSSEQFDLAEVLHDVVADNQDLAQKRQQTLTLAPVPDLPPVKGIKRLIREAVINYVTNAIKYTPEEGCIEVRAIRVDGRVRVEVEDDGIGISEENQRRLFGEFVRIKSVKPIEGSGLGLSIVKRIAEIHGGSVDVSSKEGQGSVFSLELPI